MKAHPAVSAKQEGASHCLIGDDVPPYCKLRGGCMVVIKLDGHPGLSVCAEKLLGAEAAPRSGCR